MLFLSVLFFDHAKKTFIRNIQRLFQLLTSTSQLMGIKKEHQTFKFDAHLFYKKTS